MRPQPGPRPTRRQMIYAGWLGGLGLTLGDYLKLRAADPARKIEPKARSVIHIYLQGGFAHMDSFDPKPDAPAEYRGILDPVGTNCRASTSARICRRRRRWPTS